MNHLRLIGRLMLLLDGMVAGCRRDTPLPDRGRFDVVHDTIGDTIVVLNAGDGVWGAGNQVVEELRIGDSSGGPGEFGKIVDLAIGPHDAIIVYDAGSKAIRLFDSSGRFVRRFGEQGKGPGEYQGIDGVAVIGNDRVLGFDSRLERINIYSMTGSVIGHISGVDTRFSGAANTLMVDSAKRIYVIMVSRAADPMASRIGYLRFDSAGRFLDTLFAPPSRPLGAPYSPIPLWGLLPNGTLVTADGARYLIDRPLDERRILRFGRSDVAAVPIDGEQRRDLEKRMEQQQRDAPGAQSLGEIPATKPALKSLRAREDGRIWVAPHVASIRNTEPIDTTLPEWDRPARWFEPSIWDIFAGDGTLLGRVELPRGATIFRARGLLAWGVVRDENDIPYVVRWRIVPAAASPPGLRSN